MSEPADPLGLRDIRVIDNHCHAIEQQQASDAETFRGHFTESPDPEMRSRHVTDTAFYRRLVAAMGVHLGTSGDEADVLRARARLDARRLVGDLFDDAGIGGVVVDTGYPDPATVMSVAAFRHATRARYVALLRLEVLFQQLVAEHASYPALVDAVRDALHDLRGSGFAGLKSVVAYRTGLAVERWSEDDTHSAFAAARDEVGRTGAVRLGHKPLLDTLLHHAFEAAAAQELPVQFHVAYGDPDVDLRAASPLQLRAVLEQPAYRAMPIVLLHGCWPYVREGAYLASVYGNAHLDVSYAIPFLSRAEQRAMTSAALSVAPFGKILYSSDGARVPELHWLGAHDGRRAISAALLELVRDGDLDVDQARRAGERMLRDNAHALYGFGADA